MLFSSRKGVEEDDSSCGEKTSERIRGTTFNTKTSYSSVEDKCLLCAAPQWIHEDDVEFSLNSRRGLWE